MPRLSVIVPVYRATYLREALASVAAQQHQPDEIIVIDDGSPDREAIDAAVEVCGDRVKVIRQ